MKLNSDNVLRLLPTISTFIFLVVALIVVFDHQKWKKNEVLNYDVFGYHNYLPALSIYKDITSYAFIDSIEAQYKPTQGNHVRYGLHPVLKTQNLCNQYPIGVSLFQAPFYCIAHAWTIATDQNKPDGYSSPYQHSIVLSTLLFAWLSLLVLIKFLKAYFDPISISITVLLLTFATNFFHYATLESGLSHIYLFFLYSCMLLSTQRWYTHASWLNSLCIGLCIGLAIITRPLDILVVLIPLLWVNPSSSISKMGYLQKQKKFLLFIVLITFSICMLQMSLWKYVTGDWIYYTYDKNDYFQFDRFRVFHGLFSYRKGWFLYTPLVFFAFLQALKLHSKERFRFYNRVFWLYFIPMIYLVFSWHNWFYGWSFGCRALLGSLPVLAIPIALFIQHIRSVGVLKKTVSYLGLLFLIFLNLFQGWQYENHILHGSSMNEALYWQIFLKTERPSNYDKTIHLQEEIDQITGGW